MDLQSVEVAIQVAGYIKYLGFTHIANSLMFARDLFVATIFKIAKINTCKRNSCVHVPELIANINPCEYGLSQNADINPCEC